MGTFIEGCRYVVLQLSIDIQELSMQFQISASAAMEILRLLEKINPSCKRCSLQIVAKKDTVTWTIGSDDGTVTMASTSIVDIEQEGQYKVQLHTLSQLIATFQAEKQLLFSVKQHRLQIKTPQSRCSIGFQQDEKIASYLVENSEQDNLIFALPLKQLSQAVNQTAFAAAGKNDGRRFFQCICINPRVDGLDFVASNIARMSHTFVQCSHNVAANVIVPATDLSNFCNALSGDITVKCYIKYNGVLFVAENVRHFIVLPEGMYPKYSDIYPPMYTSVAAIDSALMRKAIERAMIYMDNPLNGIVVKKDEEGRLLVEYRQEEGETSTVIECDEHSGPAFSMTVPCVYLLDAVKNTQGTAVIQVCQQTGRRWPFIMKTGQGIQSIMPIMKG